MLCGVLLLVSLRAHRRVSWHLDTCRQRHASMPAVEPRHSSQRVCIPGPPCYSFSPLMPAIWPLALALHCTLYSMARYPPHSAPHAHTRSVSDPEPRREILISPAPPTSIYPASLLCSHAVMPTFFPYGSCPIPAGRPAMPRQPLQATQAFAAVIIAHHARTACMHGCTPLASAPLWPLPLCVYAAWHV